MGCHELWTGVLLLSLSAAIGCRRSAESPAPEDTAHSGKASAGSEREPNTGDADEPSRPLVPDEWRADGLREWRYIVIHHTATEQGSVESIHESHLKRKDKDGNPWMGIGYHFVIGNGDGMADGDIEPTFRWRGQLHGAHAGNQDYNQHGIGIVLVGNFEKTPPSELQLAAVKRLVAFLKEEHEITEDRIVGHHDIRITACPGQYFPLAEVRQAVMSVSAIRPEPASTSRIAAIGQTDIRE